MAGEALIHTLVYMDAATEDGGFDFHPMLRYIKPIASGFDLAYYNQESILGGTQIGIHGYPAFCSPTEVGDAFIDAGFNLISSATNHTMDFGERGVRKNLEYWNTQKGKVLFTGQWSSWEDRERNVTSVHELNGIRYAFLAYTLMTNEQYPPEGKEYLTSIYSDEKASEDISRIKDKADIIIVAMHWGEEYNFDTIEEQERIAMFLSKLGVRIIIGTHAHVVQPVEFINNGQTLVAYCMGNFLSNQIGIERRIGLMLSVDISKTGSAITLNNLQAELEYCRSNPEGKKDYKLLPCTENIEKEYPELCVLPELRKIVDRRCPELSWGIS